MFRFHAADLKRQIVGAGLSTIGYNSPKPAEILAEDKIVGAARGEEPQAACLAIMELRPDVAGAGMPTMNREQVVATLRAHEQELKDSGIVRLSLFGSVARGDASAKSDVDLMAEFDESKRFSLLDMVGLENRLADILGVPVDLAPAKSLKDGIRERATREAVLAF